MSASHSISTKTSSPKETKSAALKCSIRLLLKNGYATSDPTILALQEFHLRQKAKEDRIERETKVLELLNEAGAEIGRDIATKFLKSIGYSVLRLFVPTSEQPTFSTVGIPVSAFYTPPSIDSDSESECSGCDDHQCECYYGSDSE